MTSIRIPVTNVYAKGGYTARLFVGSQRHAVNLILDTGSSSLVIHDNDYDPLQDSHLTGTALVQDVQYGKGGWYGPVIQTSIIAGLHGHHAELDGVSVALASQTQVASFLEADGILGLPLLNNYYTIFDRSAGDTGEIHFATKVDIPGHMIKAIHHALQPVSKGNKSI